MRRALAALGVAAALLAAGCGGEDESERLIPASRATALRATLAQLEEARSTGRCIEARSLAQEARRQAGELPGSVDGELRRRIRRGISRIFELLPDQCRSEDESPPVTTQEPVETESVPTTEAPVETTEPTETETPPTTAPPTTPTPPPTTPTPDPGDDGTGGSPGGEGEG